VHCLRFCVILLQARKRYPPVRFEVADVLNQPAAVLDIAQGCSSSSSSSSSAAGDVESTPADSSSSGQQCNVVFADIGGNRQLEALLRLLPWVLQHLKPRLLVVKSEELAAAAEQRLQHQQQQGQQEQHYQQQHEELQTQQTDGQQQLPHQALQLHDSMQHLQQQLQAATVASTAAANGMAGAAIECTVDAASNIEQMQKQQQQQSSAGAAAAAGQILNPQAWWDWLEVQRGLNPLLHSGHAEPWFLQARAQGFVRNPLRYPQRFTADGTRICRPHNYDKCLKIDTCGFDHVHCHHCGAAGHRAVDCHIIV
jgi:hypothetical protein